MVVGFVVYRTYLRRLVVQHSMVLLALHTFRRHPKKHRSQCFRNSVPDAGIATSCEAVFHRLSTVSKQVKEIPIPGSLPKQQSMALHTSESLLQSAAQRGHAILRPGTPFRNTMTLSRVTDSKDSKHVCSFRLPFPFLNYMLQEAFALILRESPTESLQSFQHASLRYLRSTHSPIRKHKCPRRLRRRLQPWTPLWVSESCHRI